MDLKKKDFFSPQALNTPPVLRNSKSSVGLFGMTGTVANKNVNYKRKKSACVGRAEGLTLILIFTTQY